MSEEEGLGIETNLTFEQAIMRTRVALRTNGFGVLSEMPTPPTIGGNEGRSHIFLTVWQHIFGTGNLGAEGTDIGDHLPVSVVVWEEGGHTWVAVTDPKDTMAGFDVSEIEKAEVALREMLAQVVAPREE